MILFFEMPKTVVNRAAITGTSGRIGNIAQMKEGTTYELAIVLP